MIKKGIILAGGKGSRMGPITKATNKQLLPIHDKPLFFYSLSILMLAKIKDILIIVNQDQLEQFKKILPNGNNLGIKINYSIQKEPKGLPDAFIIGEKFIGKSNVALILGDNFFFGQSLTEKLIDLTKINKGAKILIHPVKDPGNYGVAKIGKNKKIIEIIEKPKKPKSNMAISGLYFFDNKVVNFSKKLKKSKRNELEIIDLLKKYKQINQLRYENLGRGAAWLDAGSIQDLQTVSNFVSTIETRQGFKIGCLEEIAFKNKWIGKKEIKKSINFYGKCEYSNYLTNFL
jgi:glucose-1-phosphate thymidylyltransferase